jgi:hypothetical protein
MGGRTVLVAAETAERPVHARTSSGAARTMRRRATNRGACGRMTGSTMASTGKASAETTNRATDALCESIDSPGRRHAQRATATVSIGTRLPALNLARAPRESTRFRCPVHIGVRAMTLFRVPDWFFRCTDAQARPRRWIARREALRRGFVHVGERARILTCGCALFVGLDARWLPPRSPRHLVPPFSCWHCILRASALHRGRPRPAATA